MIELVAALGLFGGLLGSADDCSHAETRARRGIERIEQQWPIRASADVVTRYINTLGLTLSHFEPVGGPPRMLVLHNLKPMAFALGEKHFIISDGLIAMVHDESQLAAVLAHELAHQHLGHFCRSESQATEHTRIGSVVQHFDLDLEIEADRTAVPVLRAAGFNTDAMRAILQCLANRNLGDPSLQQRIEQLSDTATLPQIAFGADSADFHEVRDIIRQEIDDLGADIPVCP